MNVPESPRTVQGHGRGPSAESRTQTKTKTKELHSPDLQTSFSTREPGQTNRVNRGITYADALTRIVSELRPLWDADKIHHEIINDPRPNAIAAPAAIFAALDPTMILPGCIGTYRPPTHKPEPSREFPRAPRCPHGTLADHDGRGTNCLGCGTQAFTPSAELLAAIRTDASRLTRSTPAPA